MAECGRQGGVGARDRALLFAVVTVGAHEYAVRVADHARVGVGAQRAVASRSRARGACVGRGAGVAGPRLFFRVALTPRPRINSSTAGNEISWAIAGVRAP